MCASKAALPDARRNSAWNTVASVSIVGGWHRKALKKRSSRRGRGTRADSFAAATMVTPRIALNCGYRK